jgi:adenylate kinase family enzyme
MLTSWIIWERISRSDRQAALSPSNTARASAPLPRPRRVVVVGTSGSGKTTLAREVAGRLALPHVELDALHWGPGWTEPPVEEFRLRVEAALQGESWVADGNYGKVRDLVWGRAEMLVWLDYGLPLVMARLVRRTLRRVLVREELWNGNRERLREQFTRDSLWLWALQSHRRHRREYPARFQRPEYCHLAVVRLRSPRAAARWLASLKR